MSERKSRVRLTGFIVLVAASLILFSMSSNLFYASAVSISLVNHYPVDGETYDFVDHFVEQTTAVNTNTTVSISIDNGSLIPMVYQGIRAEKVVGDNETRSWYTWNVSTTAITESGEHTYQFFRHYYVWQEADQYWGEFNSHSKVMSFTISDSTISPSPSPSSTPILSSTPTIAPTEAVTSSPTVTASPSSVPATGSLVLTLIVVAASAITFCLLLLVFVLRKYGQKPERVI